MRTNNINIRIKNANTLTPKPITTQEAIISVIESTIKSIGPTLTYCKYINHKSNEIGHGQGIFRVQDKNVIMYQLKPIKQIFILNISN